MLHVTASLSPGYRQRVQIPTISPLVLQTLGFEVFIIHLSSSSEEGTCSVPLNYRILLCQLQWDRQECYGWLRETVRYTKFLGFIRTVLFQGRDSPSYCSSALQIHLALGDRAFDFFFPSPSCLRELSYVWLFTFEKKKKKNHLTLHWNADSQAQTEKMAFVSANKKLVARLSRAWEVGNAFVFTLMKSDFFFFF